MTIDTMEKEQAGKVEEMLRELGKKIDVLIEEAKEAKDDLRDDIEEKINEFKKKKEKVEEDLSNYKKEERWQEAKSHFTSAISELKHAIESLISSIRK
jgi:predicted  nucleic acid-binding Zn-ribbon protein